MADDEKSGMEQARENFERNRSDDYRAGRADWAGKPTGGNSSGCVVIFLILTIAIAIGSLIVYKVI